MTDQELEENPTWIIEKTDEESTKENYSVFQKTSQRRSMTFVVFSGLVEATSPARALERAIEAYGDVETYVWRFAQRGQSSKADSLT